MPSSLDPLRYGLRALEEMAREQASVTPPAKVRDETFSPHPVLRPPAREGAALSLRLFGDTPDDATGLVLGETSSQELSPIPARAVALFEAHAAAMAAENDDALTLGFPLVTFVQQGSARAAPLFSRGGARAVWRTGTARWKVPAAGVTFAPPDTLVLQRADDEPYTLHAGVWHYLFGLDASVLARITAKAGLPALVRLATRALQAGEDEVEGDVETGPLGKEDLEALGEAALRRAPPSRALRCHPHGLVMLPPRGDPTSGLRADLNAVLEEPLPPRGPLAVYLGASAAPARRPALFARTAMPPTPSQRDAARAFEGSQDLVAVCGPPGCGKTALLHQTAAETVVACARGKLWSSAPSRTAPWPLVVTSTNNAAVDQALAPFVSGPGLPIAIRLGHRRALAEVTSAALDAVIRELQAPAPVALAEARADFDRLAAPLRDRPDVDVPDGPPPPVTLAELAAAEAALREHVEAAARVRPLHLEGKRASPDRAREKWARANDLRRARIEPVLIALGRPLPFGDLGPDAAADIERQQAAMREALTALETARAMHAPVDPGLYDAALRLRDAWARTHKATLLPRLVTARDSARGAGRVPLPIALRELASLFPVAGCTLLSMRPSFPFGRDVIDRLVIDEAAQCAPIYAVPALARARRAMLTGDVAQLPPVYTLDARVDDRLAKELNADAVAPFRMHAEATTSAQAVAEPRTRARVTLREHFRSQPEIVALASAWSGYELDVRTPRRPPILEAPVRVLPVRGVGARAAEGVVNEAEATFAQDLVTDLVARGVEPADVAVLTPFVGQSIRIERALLARGLHVLVSTVHRLQGGERRVVIFSVTATERRHLRFIGERPHLLHVATSRAQDQLVVLVDPDALERERALAPLRAFTAM